jgi:hypothetical protein
MSSALLGVAVLCLCSSSATGAGSFFGGFIPGTSPFITKKLKKLIQTIITDDAKSVDCANLYKYMEEIGGIIAVESVVRSLSENEQAIVGKIHDIGRKAVTPEKICNTSIVDSLQKAIIKIENKDTSVCTDLKDLENDIPRFIWDKKTKKFIETKDLLNEDQLGTVEEICNPNYSPMASPDELSENAKNLISAIEQFDDGFSPEKCTDFKEKWDKMIDGRKLNEIFTGRGSGQRITDPELNFIYSKPKYKGVIQTLGEAFVFREDIPDSELPPGVTRAEQSDEEIINKFCISDLKRKIDERVTLLKNEDIQGCDLYDDNWTTIREDWNTGFVWNDSNDKILVAHNYVSKALGETNEDLMDGKITARETLCTN